MRLQKYINEQNQYKLYVDMDGVLVNWIKGVLDIGLPSEIAKNPRVKKNQVILWGAIDELGAVFWENLKWLPDGKKLWDYIKEYQPIILSAHSKRKGGEHWEKRLEVIQGKRNWLIKNTDTFTAKSAIIIQQPDKIKHAGPNKILIDDDIRNIKGWKSAGGIAIHHKNATQTIKELKMKFKEYLKEELIPKGLLNWVKDYKSARIKGNVKLAKEIKANIDKEIKKLKLNPKKVYGEDRRSMDYGVVIPDRRKGK